MSKLTTFQVSVPRGSINLAPPKYLNFHAVLIVSFRDRQIGGLATALGGNCLDAYAEPMSVPAFRLPKAVIRLSARAVHVA